MTEIQTSNPSNCAENLLWPSTQVCDAAGKCLATGLCLCEDGWSGSGDFTSLDRNTLACDINESVVRVIWSVMGFLCVPPILFTLNAFQFELASLLKRKQFGIWEKTIVATRLGSGGVFFLACFCLGAAALLKVTSPSLEDRRIGNDPTITELWFAGLFFFWIGVPVALWCFSAVSIKALGFDAATVHLLHKLQFYTVCVTIFQLVPNFVVPMLMLVVNEKVPLLAAIHYITISLIILAEASLANQIMTPLIQRLECVRRVSGASQGHKETGSEKSMRRMKFLRYQYRSIAYQNVAVAVLFSFPFLSAKASYQLPIAAMSGAAVVCIVSYTLSPLAFHRLAGSGRAVSVNPASRTGNASASVVVPGN